MAEPRHRMDDGEIAALVDAEIQAAMESFRSSRKGDTDKAIKYYRGEMDDLSAEPGRSQVVDHTVQDVIGWLLPGLMRVFFSVDQIVVYEPKGPEDEAGAAQATDYVNHIVLNESNAYQVFWDAFHDALLHRNGIVKHFWDDTPETVSEELTGLTDDEFVAAVMSEDVEVVKHTEREEPSAEPPLYDAYNRVEVPAPPIVLHDVKITRTVSNGTMKLMAVAPENFLINDEAKEISEKTRFVGERVITTRSELLGQGYNRDKVADLVGGYDRFDGVDDARRHGVWQGTIGKDKATEEIEIFECYPLVDYDGDGIAERLKVIWAHGGQGERSLLDWEEWEDELPYSDLTPERTPHRWEGRSVFDDTEDIQRIKTALMRMMLDNLYMSNIPDRAVNFDKVKNADAVYERRLGNIIPIDGDPNGVIVNLEVPFTAQHSFTALEYLDQVTERRTGVSRSAMGLDPETLQNQSATAATIQQSAQYSKIELIARNFAELGMKRVFRCLLKLIVKHQDRARTIRLRNKWVEMDPTGWSADMDATINVGLGSGSRDRDLMFLNLVLQQQQAAFQMAGGMGTPYGQKLAKAMLHTAQKIIEATGLKSPDMYFPEVTDEDMQAIAQAQGQNPEMQKVQAQMQLEEAKSAAQMQMEQTKLQAQMQADQVRAQQDGQLKLEIAKMDGEIRLKGIETDAQLREYQINREMDLKTRQLIDELALKRELGLASAKAKNGSGTSDVHMGGEPG